MSKLFFKDDAAVWFVAAGKEVMGPLKASEVYERLQNNEISWVHFISKVGASDEDQPPQWLRICDVQTFKEVGPQTPKASKAEKSAKGDKPAVKKVAKKPPPTDADSSVQDWFLYFNQAQQGPFSKEEIERLLKVGKIHARVHAWRDGMEDWKRLSDVDDFESATRKSRAESAKTSTKVQETRNAPRRPLVAKIYASNERVLASGICRDISVGGMQVLMDRIPGKVGERIKLNISPVDEGLMKPFVAKGVIVRVLDENNGFSFRFDNLSADAKAAIEKFIEIANE